MKYQLGRWDLSELVKDPKSPAFARQLKILENKVKNFERNKKSLRPTISFQKFQKIIQSIEEIEEKSSMVGSYASLLHASDTQSDFATTLLTRISKFGSEIDNRLLFFDLWWMQKIDQKNANRLIKKSGNLAEYFRHERRLAKYSLTEPEEKIINILDVTGSSALVKLYDKITNAFEYVAKIDGKKRKYTREEMSGFFRNPKSKTRETAYKTILSKFQKNKGTLGEIYQNLVLNLKDEGIQLRGFSSPISIMNIDNNLDDATVNSLLRVCKKNTPIFQKFFRQKAKMLKVKKIRRYDLYAPVGNKIKQKTYSFEKAVKLVLGSFENFSPQLSDFAHNVFKKNHIDSQIRPGKRDGAFCSAISPKITPYVHINYNGKSQDVFTLAHELGHAIHDQAASHQSILVSDAPLPLAETASTFSELLLFDKISKQVSLDEKRKMLSNKIDELYATIMRQAFFTTFEISAHDKIGKNVTVDEVSQEYLKNLKKQFSNSIVLSDDFMWEWVSIPHFFHSPFYCYAYSFGNLLALSLYQRFKKEGRDFAPTYIKILEAGGSKKPESLLNEYGINIRSQKFWQDGFDYIEEQVRNLTRLN